MRAIRIRREISLTLKLKWTLHKAAAEKKILTELRQMKQQRRKVATSEGSNAQGGCTKIAK